MPDRFRIRRPFNRALSGLEQKVDRTFEQTRLFEVMRHQLGLRFDRLRKVLIEGARNLTMELLALAPH